MKARYTVPVGPTAIAGSQLAPRDPGAATGLLKVRPPSVERAYPIPKQPIHRSYTNRGAAVAVTTSAFWPEQPLLTLTTWPTLPGRAARCGARLRVAPAPGTPVAGEHAMTRAALAPVTEPRIRWGRTRPR